VNCSLAFFNVLPFPPLDGSKMLARFLPVRWSEWLDDNQMMLGMLLLFVFMSPLRHVILYPAVQLAMGLVYAWGWMFSLLGWGAL
jgi:Zn-dependent protease